MQNFINEKIKELRQFTEQPYFMSELETFLEKVIKETANRAETLVMPKIAEEMLSDEEVERLVEVATKNYRAGKHSDELWDIVKTLARGCRERSARIINLERIK